MLIVGDDAVDGSGGFSRDKRTSGNVPLEKTLSSR